MANCERCYHVEMCIFRSTSGRELCTQFKDKELIAELHHGEWKTRYDFDEKDYYCSNCGKKALTYYGYKYNYALSDYCPHCGAKMEGEND